MGEREFMGNVSRRNLDPMIIARYVRFLPLEYNIEPVVRLEFYGCMGGMYGSSLNMFLLCILFL